MSLMLDWMPVSLSRLSRPRKKLRNLQAGLQLYTWPRRMSSEEKFDGQMSQTELFGHYGKFGRVNVWLSVLRTELSMVKPANSQEMNKVTNL